VITIIGPVNGIRLNNTDPTTDQKKKTGTGKSLYNSFHLFYPNLVLKLHLMKA